MEDRNEGVSSGPSGKAMNKKGGWYSVGTGTPDISKRREGVCLLRPTYHVGTRTFADTFGTVVLSGHCRRSKYGTASISCIAPICQANPTAAVDDLRLFDVDGPSPHTTVLRVVKLWRSWVLRWPRQRQVAG